MIEISNQEALLMLQILRNLPAIPNDAEANAVNALRMMLSSKLAQANMPTEDMKEE